MNWKKRFSNKGIGRRFIGKHADIRGCEMVIMDYTKDKGYTLKMINCGIESWQTPLYGFKKGDLLRNYNGSIRYWNNPETFGFVD